MKKHTEDFKRAGIPHYFAIRQEGRSSGALGRVQPKNAARAEAFPATPAWCMSNAAATVPLLRRGDGQCASVR